MSSFLRTIRLALAQPTLFPSSPDIKKVLASSSANDLPGSQPWAKKATHGEEEDTSGAFKPPFDYLIVLEGRAGQDEV
jgi:hypothetical protein